MKVLLYQGGSKLAGKSGIGRAVRHQERALIEAGIEYTLDSSEEYDAVQLNTVFPDSYFMSLRARLAGKKVIYYGHSTMEDFRNSFAGSNTAAPLFKWWISKCYAKGDVVVTPTPYSRNILSTYGLDKPIVALSNGVDLEKFVRSEEGGRRFREKYCFTPDDKVVLGVGHYMERKGILDFVEMAREFPQYEFIWFGKTPKAVLTKEVRKALKEELPNLQFPGYVQQTELIEAYSGCDLFFFPTLEETEGIVVLEAMAMEIPILIRDIPVYADWLTHGKDVYKGKNITTFRRIMPRILEGTLPDLTEEARKNAMGHNLKRIGEELGHIYETLKEPGWEKYHEDFNYNRLV